MTDNDRYGDYVFVHSTIPIYVSAGIQYKRYLTSNNDIISELNIELKFTRALNAQMLLLRVEMILLLSHLKTLIYGGNLLIVQQGLYQILHIFIFTLFM